jgi:hypothetical protein
VTLCGVVKSTTGEIPLDTVSTGLLNDIHRVLKLVCEAIEDRRRLKFETSSVQWRVVKKTPS